MEREHQRNVMSWLHWPIMVFVTMKSIRTWLKLIGQLMHHSNHGDRQAIPIEQETH